MAHSGVIHGDLDHLKALDEIKLALMQDPHVVYVFISPRGDGLKYGVRVVPVDTDEAYQHAWQVVADAHQKQYGITWDPSGKDVCRLCFASWDPSCFINPDAQIFNVPPPQPAPSRPQVVMSRHWSSPRLQTAAQLALDRAERLIAHAPEGSRHSVRIRASYLIGGLLDSANIAYDVAIERLTTAALGNTDEEREARRDIADGLKAGQSKPITTPHMRQGPSDWHNRTITPAEVPSWRKC